MSILDFVPVVGDRVGYFHDLYHDAVIADEPYAYYRLNETSGTTAADASGNGRDGTYQGSPTLGGTAVTFNGTNQRVVVSVANIGGLGSLLDTGYTVEFWLRTTTTTLNSAVFGVFNTATATAFQFLVHQGAVGTHRMFVRAETGDPVPSATITFNHASLNDGNWHHVVVRGVPADGTNRAVFVDGVSVSFTGTGTLGAQGTANFGFPLAIGASNNRGTIENHFNGSLDEVAFYTTALSTLRVQTHYAGVGVPKGTWTSAKVVSVTDADNVGLEVGGQPVNGGLDVTRWDRALPRSGWIP